MKVAPRRTVDTFAGFLIVFCLVVFGLWVWGGEAFSALMRRSRAYTPPQFLTWLSLVASLSMAAAFCLMPFSLFRIVRGRADVPVGWIVLCVAGFLFLSGLSAFLYLVTIWFQGPLAVWTLVLTRVGAALLAVGTLLVLRAAVPQILRIPTHAQWLSVNNELLRVEADAKAKEKLLAAVGHELRAPLAPLLATLSELDELAQVHDDRAMQDRIETLRKNINREASLVTALLDRFELPGPAADAVAPATNYPRVRRLLLVEDHAETLQTFARILRRKGFEVQEATTVAEAITVSRPGDLLLSDIGLPDGDGRDLMRQLGARGIPGIAISGFGTAKDLEVYRLAGLLESLVYTL
jgi:CheY-like chemotaxis protein